MDMETLHILPADIEHERDIRQKMPGRRQVGHCLHLADVRLQGGFDQLFAVTGHSGGGDPGSGTQATVELTAGGDGGLQGFALVADVIGI